MKLIKVIQAVSGFHEQYTRCDNRHQEFERLQTGVDTNCGHKPCLVGENSKNIHEGCDYDGNKKGQKYVKNIYLT